MSSSHILLISIIYKQLGQNWKKIQKFEYYLSVNEVCFASLNNIADIGIVRQKCAHFCPFHVILITLLHCYMLYFVLVYKYKNEKEQ